MKSRPYPIPYPADPGIDSGPAVGHQQQAVREDIPRIGFPEGVEQKTSQYGNEADVDVEPIRTKSIRAMPIRGMPIRAMPIRAMLIRAMPIRTKSIRAMLIRAMSIRAMLIRAMPIRAMSVRAKPVRTKPVHTKPVRTRPVCSAPCGMPRRLVRSAPCGMPRRLVSHVPDNFGFPTFLKTVDTEHQHAQIQNILPCIAPFDISPTERTFIDFFKKCTPSSVGSQGSLSAGIGAVRPLG